METNKLNEQCQRCHHEKLHLHVDSKSSYCFEEDQEVNVTSNIWLRNTYLEMQCTVSRYMCQALDRDACGSKKHKVLSITLIGFSNRYNGINSIILGTKKS